MGYTAFRRSQLGVETVAPGTAATATRQLVGALSMRNTPMRELREERRASMGGSNTYDDLSYSSEGSYRGRLVTNEAPYWLSCSIGNGAITSPDGSGEPYLHTHEQPLTTADLTASPLTSLTGYVGDNQQALRTAGMYARRVVIRGTDRGAWEIEVDLFGREQVTGTFAALTHPANETIKNLLSRVYIDDTAGGIGGTQITATYYSFVWTFNTGISPDYTMDGQLDMTGIQRDIPTCTLELTSKWNTNTVAEFSDWRSPSGIRYVSLYNEGSTISTTYEHSVRINGAYVYTDFNAMDNERDGTTITRATLALVEDATIGGVSVAVQNTLSAL